MDRKRLAMNISLFVAVLMLVGKLTAYFLTGSSAILSDAAESIVHIFATGFAAMSLRFAEVPADRNHPYGHGKVVSFSIGIEGALIIAAALFIIFEAVPSLIYGPELRSLDIGIVITGTLAIVNFFLGMFLIRTGKNENSPVLIANGSHILTDMWTSVAVVIGVALVWISGIAWLDPLVALIAAVQIIFTGSRLVSNAIGVAMDQASTSDTEELQRALEVAQEEGLISGYHQLRHRRANNVCWIELHMLVPGNLSVAEAHHQVTEVECRLESALSAEHVYVTTHIEPDDHDHAHPEGHGNDPLKSSIS